jgi:uncharacterized protein YicC (UPF0701 family)
LEAVMCRRLLLEFFTRPSQSFLTRRIKKMEQIIADLKASFEAYVAASQAEHKKELDAAVAKAVAEANAANEAHLVALKKEMDDAAAALKPFEASNN